MPKTEQVEFRPKMRRAAGAARWKRRRSSEPNSITPSVHAGLSPVWETVHADGAVAETSGRATLLRRDAFFRRMLATVDVIAAYVALVVAVYLVGDGSVSLRPSALLIAPMIVVASKAIGLYDRDQHILRKTTIDEVPEILYLAILYALTVWLAEAVLVHGWLARPQVFALTLASFGLIAVGRLLARSFALKVSPPERCVVLGGEPGAARIAEKLEQTRSVNAQLIGRIALHSDDDGHAPGALTRLGDYDSLLEIVARHRVERVIIVPEGDREDELLHAIRTIKALGAKVSVLPRLLEVVGSSSSFDDIDGICLLGVRQYGLSKSSEHLKRTMDVVGAAAVIFLLAPLLLMLALAVKLTSRGPVFFRQPRIGRTGERFAMLKFRSMIDGADQYKATLSDLNEAQGGLFKISEDPRLTPVGRLLRRTSLDELPQLVNVLKADMSLVGPRPLVPAEDALIEGWQRRRLAVRPGMTGLWQIFGSSRIPMHEMVKIDYIYGANWSLWLDLKILLRTIPYVLARRGL
jgi:exopolysaccharide biosynthesis polyprenyl glycosylphosphotransferase